MIDIYLDCDGVLANFNKAAFAVIGKDYDEDTKLEWNFWRHYGIKDEDFYSKIKGYDFWYNIEQFPWTKRLISSLSEIGDLYICTAPTDDAQCLAAKWDWLRYKCNLAPDRIIMTSSKDKLAHSKAVLIDDRVLNVRKFIKRNGHGLLFPNQFNTATGDYITIIDKVKRFQKSNDNKQATD